MHKTEVLERVALDVLGVESERLASIDELSREAEQLLGYDKLKKALGKVVPTLAATLVKHGIEPYSRESVNRYKSTFPKQIENPKASEFVKRHPKLMEIFQWAICILFLGSLAVFALSMLAGIVWGIGEPSFLKTVPIGWCIALSLIGFFASLALCNFILENERLSLTLNPTWKRVPIKEYNEEIPEHVLEKAIAIKKEIGDASFFVEKLEYIPDPFLVVVCGTEEYYIEVWDEPKFERLQ